MIKDMRNSLMLSGSERTTLNYIEQLASQTSTDISEWDFTPFAACPPDDRRAINKVFFHLKDERAQGLPAITITIQEVLADVAAETKKTTDARIKKLQGDHKAYLDESLVRYASAQNFLTHAWNFKKEEYALTARGSDYILTDINRVIAQGFWEYHDYANGVLRLATKVECIMSETNKAAGIDRRVNMGKYLARLNVKTMSLELHRYLQNPLAPKGPYHHPYVGTDGQICWGNAASTAARHLASGQVFEVLNLLISLLVTYTPEATPYARLHEFDRCLRRYNASDSLSHMENCKRCEESQDDCNCCSHCEQTESDCDCCSECNSRRDDCECCSICNGNRNDCECCSECEKTADDCTCCGTCGSDCDSCRCCQDCGRRFPRIEVDGHSTNCEFYLAPIEASPTEPAEEIPTPIEQPQESEELPF